MSEPGTPDKKRPGAPPPGGPEPSCQDIVNLLNDYVDGEFNANTQKAFARHFAHCPPCLEFLESYRRSIELGRNAPCEEIPSAVREGLRSFLRENGVPVPGKKQ